MGERLQGGRRVVGAENRRKTLNVQHSTVGQEVEQVIRLLRAACHRGAALLNGGIDCPATRRALAAELDELGAAHRRVWRLRNREGGLDDSLARLLGIRAEYLP